MDGVSLGLGVLGIALQLLNIVAKFLDAVRNAPDEIRILHILLTMIAKDYGILKSYAGPGGLIEIPEMAERVVTKTLRDCKTFLAEYITAYEDKGRIRRALGLATGDGGRLKDIRMRIGRIYPDLITPLSQSLMLAKLSPAGHGGALSPPQLAEMNEADVGMVFPETYVEKTEPLLSQLSLLAVPFVQTPATPELLAQANGRVNVDVSVPENVQQYEQRLQMFDTFLGLKLLDILHDGTVAIDTNFHSIRDTTLTLKGDGIPLQYPGLKLEALQVAARDNETTVLRFRCADGITSVNHIVTLATLPYISDITSCDVSFRGTHVITLMCGNKHHLFKAQDPRYQFTDLETRRKFQGLVRERELVGEFEASEVATLIRNPKSCWRVLFFQDAGWAKLRCLAVGEPLQVWKLERLEPGRHVPTVIMTMSFLESTAGGFSHMELHFEPDVSQVEIVKAEGSSKRKAVEGPWVVPQENADRIRITFQAEKEAARFRKLFKVPSQAPCIPHLEIQPLEAF